MTKLDKAVSIAMGMELKEEQGLWWVKVHPSGLTAWAWIDGWTARHGIADKLMDDHKIETEYFGRRWCATCEGVSAQHQDRKTAALMAFCKHKGVAYE